MEGGGLTLLFRVFPSVITRYFGLWFCDRNYGRGYCGKETRSKKLPRFPTVQSGSIAELRVAIMRVVMRVLAGQHKLTRRIQRVVITPRP